MKTTVEQRDDTLLRCPYPKKSKVVEMFQIKRVS